MVYYRYKKERLSEKFNSAHEFLIKIRKAVQLYCLDPNEIIARGMTGYFSDFTEYIIDICETYLVINDRYNPRLSGVDLIKSATREGLMAIPTKANKYIFPYFHTIFIPSWILRANSSKNALKKNP